jgi:hypothetical protein
MFVASLGAIERTAGFLPATRADSGRRLSREPQAKSGANGYLLALFGATTGAKCPRSSRADPGARMTGLYGKRAAQATSDGR